MSTPITDAADLALLAGQDVDETRATFLIAKAQELAESILSPLPATAAAIVLRVALRAYNNVNSATQVGMGSAYASLATTGAGGVGGLFLSKADKADLRRIGGRGGVSSVDILPRGVCEVQSVEVAATAGTFTLSFCGQVTTDLAFDATAAQVQAALEALTGIGAGNVLVDGSFTVSFRNNLGYQAVPQLRADDSALTGVVSVVTLEQGEPPAWGAC